MHRSRSHRASNRKPKVSKSPSSPAQETEDSFARFFALARQFTHLETLDRDTLVTFVERIEIGPKEYSDRIVKATHRNQPYRQSVRIFYKFIGELGSEQVRDLPQAVNT